MNSTLQWTPRKLVAALIAAGMSGGNDSRVFCQSQIIIGTHIQNRLSVRDTNMGILRRGDNPL